MAETLSQAAFARRVGLTTGRISQLKKQGVIAMSDDGLVLVEETEWRLADRAGNYRGGKTKAARPQPIAAKVKPDETPEQAAERIVVQEGSAPYAHAEAVRIKENYLALLRQLEFDVKSGAVVPVDVVIAGVADQYAKVRTKLLGIPTRVAPRVAVLRSAEEVRALIEVEVIQALHELSLDGQGDVDLIELRGSIRDRFGSVH